MVLLPDVVLARFQHSYALYNAKYGALKPTDLNGKRVGIRSFTTTTGAWLRGILANDYGIDLDSIDWVTFEEAHVAEYRDTTKRALMGKNIIQMLVDGELDAVLGEKVEHADLKPLFPESKTEELRWFGKHAVLPINHMVVVKQELCQNHPDIVREVHRLLAESIARDRLLFRRYDLQRSLECITKYSAQQKLIPGALAVEELFDDVTRPLFEGVPE
jgi:4,5-dihydroxyphthalate decarboxylase